MPANPAIFKALLLLWGFFYLCFVPGCRDREQNLPQPPAQTQSSQNFEQLSSRILGTWHNPGKGKIFAESWKRVDNHTLEGIGYVVHNGDTTISEQLKLQQIDNDIFYIPTVPHNPGPVYFKLVRFSEDEAVFENPEHDFPNRIIYMRPSADSLHVRIEGMGEKSGKKVDFGFTRK